MSWLLAALIGYGSIVALAYVFQRKLQYFPTAEIQDAGQYTGGLMETVTYRTADGLDLSAWFHRPREGRPTLVLFHGNGGQLGHRAPAVAPYMERGYGVLLAGYRGYGGNPGRPTEQGLYADGRAALAWLESAGIPHEQIVLYGESLGSGVAVQLASEAPVAGLILESPFTSAVDVGQAAYRWLPVRLLMWDRYDNLSKIGTVAAPLLLIHGEADQVVAPRFGRRLFEAANEPKKAWYIHDAGHNDLDFYGISEMVLEFLDSLGPAVLGRE